MNDIKIKEILKATKGMLISGNSEDVICGVKHDSRECGASDMFVAIKGENRDGHMYIPNVAAAGCKTLLVSHTEGWAENVAKDINIILVEDTEYALGELAAYYLESLNIKKIAVTGSVGKTSTRDLIYYVLSEKYNCVKNYKNYNNLIGLPLSIFQMDNTTEVAVLEMGMDRFGEIRRLCEIVKPQVGVITNIGVSHIERLGSRDGIFKAKMEIAENLPTEKNGGTLLYIYDKEYLNRGRIKGSFKQVAVGAEEGCDYTISNVDDYGIEGIKFNLAHEGNDTQVNMPLPGKHNALNGGMALAVGALMGVSPEIGCRGLAKANLTGSRLKKLKGKTVTVIDDTYNAAPDSMKGALEVLKATAWQKRKIAILGDMFELGDKEKSGHREVGAFAAKSGIDALYTVGEASRETADAAIDAKPGSEMEVKHFDSKSELIGNLGSLIKEGDIVLVKGSRGMKLEEVVEELLWI